MRRIYKYNNVSPWCYTFFDVSVTFPTRIAVLFLNQSRCRFLRFLHQHHHCQHSHCNIISNHIGVLQSNLFDYKISPCRIQVIVIFGKHLMALRKDYSMGFVFSPTNLESLAAFRLSDEPILCELNWYVVRIK